MGGAHLCAKAADYLRLARGLPSHSPTHPHLIVMAKRLERQAREFEDAAAQGRQDEAGKSESGQLLAECGVFLRRSGAQGRECRRIEAVLGDERHIDVAIAMAEAAVGEAADEVNAQQSFAELRP